MFSITIKLMKKSARMLIPAGIAILIGTAFIAATFLFSNSMDDSLRRQRTAQLGEANYIATMKTNSNGAVSENGSGGTNNRARLARPTEPPSPISTSTGYAPRKA